MKIDPSAENYGGRFSDFSLEHDPQEKYGWHLICNSHRAKLWAKKYISEVGVDSEGNIIFLQDNDEDESAKVLVRTIDDCGMSVLVGGTYRAK